MIPIINTLLEKLENPVAVKILYDPKVNPLALEKWSRLNVEPVLFRNGHSQIKQHIKSIGAFAGAEESGHYYHSLKLGNLEIAGENSLFTILLLLRTVNKNKAVISQVRAMEDQVYTSGEFNFHYTDNQIGMKAMDAVLSFFKSDGAVMTTSSEDGVDLEGTVVYKGIEFRNGKVELDKAWYSAYVRSATTEKGVVRSYVSSGTPHYGVQIKETLEKILKSDFGGKEIE